MQLILTQNNFVLGNQHYIQTFGTAMGTRFGPSMACLFMGRLEERLLQSTTVKPFIWLRYIDDVFILWTDGEQSFGDFINFANNFHPTIKFTSELSQSTISFLDVAVSLEGGLLHTDLYTKPTDKHQYLHWTSCHPIHTKRSLPYCLAFRLRRICSSDDTLHNRISELKTHLLHRGYPHSVINKDVQKALQVSRSDALQPRTTPNSSSERTPLVVNFHPALPSVGRILHTFIPILHSSARCKSAIPEAPITSFRRPKNLKDVLVKSTIPSITGPPRKGFHPCGECQVCSHKLHKPVPITHAVRSDTFRSTNNGSIYDIKQSLSCNSYNVVYLITCDRCNKQYVGETGREAKIRLLEHCADTRFKREKPVGKHFNLPGHSADDISFIVIDKPPRFDTNLRQTLEHHWIQTLQTVNPDGLNVKMTK
jgi:hypothetical protein